MEAVPDPKDSDKRRAAFAVVYHPMITPLHRARMKESFRQEPIVPDSFVVLAVGECRGQQTHSIGQNFKQS